MVAHLFQKAKDRPHGRWHIPPRAARAPQQLVRLLLLPRVESLLLQKRKGQDGMGCAASRIGVDQAYTPAFVVAARHRGTGSNCDRFGFRFQRVASTIDKNNMHATAAGGGGDGGGCDDDDDAWTPPTRRNHHTKHTARVDR